tara:strand:+ start:7281 stop:7964 length:684 start_codon:yes stop_codon:yes gene_type:complete
MSNNVLAVIPARGGSKGVPGKNKRIIGGKPLIAYSIEAAIKSKSLDRIVISTDDSDIAEIGQSYGVSVINRPESLALDDSAVTSAVSHAVKALRDDEAFVTDVVVLLQPTSPLRTVEDIDSAIDVHFKTDMNVCSVSECGDNHPARMYSILDSRLQSLMPKISSLRRQDLPKIYHRNGALYVFSYPSMVAEGIITESMVPYIMGAESSINIDTELDVALLEAVLKLS